jgi:predicted TIM-barrel fold metal-dependent hydrolase
MIAMLYAHPGLYVDVGGLHNQSLVPRASYYRHLRGLVEAGFGKRIMFGSDFQGQANAARAIDAIRAADFLTAEQKADILCGNAQRFLRLPEATCR